MVDESKVAAVEFTLLECSEWLREAPSGPAVRELRVRLGALTRVVSGWRVNQPHSAQLVAMLECALELRGLVARACASASGVADTVPPPPATVVEPPVSETRAQAQAPARSTVWPRRAARTTRPPPQDPMTRTTRPPARRKSHGG